MSRFLNLVSRDTPLRIGDLLRAHTHHSRKNDPQELRHGVSVKLYPAASQYSTRPSYAHGVEYWTVDITRERHTEWVHVVSGETGYSGWALLDENTFELCEDRNT